MSIFCRKIDKRQKQVRIRNFDVLLLLAAIVWNVFSRENIPLVSENTH